MKRLGELRSGLAQTAESNRVQVGALRKQLKQAAAEIGKNLKQSEAYKSALQQANDNIQRQNDSLKKLADERNEAVLKFNKLVEEYSDLAKKWNDLQAAGTNAVPKK